MLVYLGQGLHAALGVILVLTDLTLVAVGHLQPLAQTVGVHEGRAAGAVAGADTRLLVLTHPADPARVLVPHTAAVAAVAQGGTAL